jgi:hypothetical protein
MAETVNDSPWFASELLRQLSSLGHLDVELDPETIRPRSWSVCPSVLVQTRRDEAVLAGWRSPQLIGRLNEELRRTGGRLIISLSADQLPTIFARGLPWPQLQAACDRVTASGEHQLEYVEGASFRIAAALPSVHALAARLPRFLIPRDELEIFDLPSASWHPVREVAAPGAYRSRWRGVAYFHVSPSDVAEGQGVAADARTVKHLAAAHAHAPLMAYSSEKQILVCPVGCELPGLLDRAAVLCSGQLPKKSKGELEYMNVTESVAALAWRCLMKPEPARPL